MEFRGKPENISRSERGSGNYQDYLKEHVVGYGAEFQLFDENYTTPRRVPQFNVDEFISSQQYRYGDGDEDIITLTFQASPVIVAARGFMPFSDDNEIYQTLLYPESVRRSVAEYYAYMKKTERERGGQTQPVVDLSGADAPLGLRVYVDRHMPILDSLSLAVKHPERKKASFLLPSLTSEHVPGVVGSYSQFTGANRLQVENEPRLQSLIETLLVGGRERGGIFLPSGRDSMDKLSKLRGFIVSKERVWNENVPRRPIDTHQAS